MKALSRPSCEAAGKHRPVNGKAVKAQGLPESQSTELATWGHWFNTEGMLANNQGDPSPGKNDPH